MALFGGELLPEERFEDWAIDRRDTVKATYVELLLELADLERARARLDAAIEALKRIVAIEPLHEDAQSHLIHLHGLAGRRHLAVAHFERFRTVLRTELDAEPLPTTTEIYQSVISGQICRQCDVRPVALHGMLYARRGRLTRRRDAASPAHDGCRDRMSRGSDPPLRPPGDALGRSAAARERQDGRDVLRRRGHGPAAAQRRRLLVGQPTVRDALARPRGRAGPEVLAAVRAALLGGDPREAETLLRGFQGGHTQSFLPLADLRVAVRIDDRELEDGAADRRRAPARPRDRRRRARVRGPRQCGCATRRGSAPGRACWSRA